ncbi:MAG: iron-containing alcohol dehydrogenase [Acidobacteriota bacterium]
MLGFRMPTRIHIEPGSLDRLPEIARSLDIRSALIVADPGVRQHTDWVSLAQRTLEETGIRVEIFDGVEPNPRTTTVTRAAEVLREHELEGVVGLGGGSVLDAGKAAAMLANNELKIEQYEGKGRYANAPRPFIAVPTTCGTGSEVTWVSVLSHEPTGSKISVKGESMFPDQALVDADLLRTLPAELVAWTGLDALTHAVECVTCSAANPVSDALAKQAVTLIFRYLPRAVADIAGDDEARHGMMRASTLAGMAFGNADVAGVHCLSESIGGLYDAPHGLTNAILLVPVMRHHRPVITEQLAALDVAVHPDDAGAPADELADRFMERLEGLCKRLDVPPFSSLGVRTEDHDRLAEWAVRNGSNRSNPQPMAPSSYRGILESLSP